MTQILGISGSLRGGSYNTALLYAAASFSLPDLQLETATLHGIPLYDGDLEDQEGLPQAVVRLKERIIANQGLLLVTPEYNNSIPGVFKNAVDWLSRPPQEVTAVFGGQPVAVIGASPGNFGTLLAQNAWWPVLRTLGTIPWFEGRLLVSRASQAFDAQGQLNDAAIREKLEQFLRGFAAFVEKIKASPRSGE